MDLLIGAGAPAAADYQHLTWFDLRTITLARSLDHLGAARPPAWIRIREAMRGLGFDLMRALSSPRVRQAGSWPRFTRDGLL